MVSKAIFKAVFKANIFTSRSCPRSMDDKYEVGGKGVVHSLAIFCEKSVRKEGIVHFLGIFGECDAFPPLPLHIYRALTSCFSENIISIYSAMFAKKRKRSLNFTTQSASVG